MLKFTTKDIPIRRPGRQDKAAYRSGDLLVVAVGRVKFYQPQYYSLYRIVDEAAAEYALISGGHESAKAAKIAAQTIAP